MNLKGSLASLLRRSRPMSRADAAEIADWVNEGGSFDPAGPPQVVEDETRAGQPDTSRDQQ